MTKRNNFVFIVLQVISWIIFVGLSIEAAALLVNFIYSLFKPEVVHHLYQKLDLSEMYHRSMWAYFGMYSFILVISFLKAILFYYVILLATKLNLNSPFNTFVSKKITHISYFTLSTGILSFVARETAKNLEQHGFDTDILNQFWADSQAYIIMAAVIYIIAVIFAKGVEIQNENDLTV
jgi:hypothetical protein